MYRIMFLLAFCLPITMAATPALAIHKCGKRCVKCPRCQSCCELKAEETKEKKTCYKIECEEICVPRIVFPWQNRHLRSGGLLSHVGGCAAGGCAGSSCSGCTADGCCGAGGCGSGKCGSCVRCKPVRHNGARVIKVRRMKKHTYECPACEYSWSVKKGGNGCGAHCGGCSACVPQSSAMEEAPLEQPELEAEAPVEDAEPVETIPEAPVGTIHEFPIEEHYQPAASPSPADRQPTNADAFPTAPEPGYLGDIRQPSRMSKSMRTTSQKLKDMLRQNPESLDIAPTGFFESIDSDSK